MPHCCPQKQQWVLTRRSGSTLVERRTPVIDDRCGPKRSIIRSGPTGTSATAGTLPPPRASACRVPPPQRPLRQAEERPATLRADLLVVPAVRKLITEP